MTNLHDLVASLSATTAEALHALGDHLNHEQITGTLHNLADDADRVGQLLREAGDLVPAAVPDAAATDSTPDTSGRHAE